MDDKERTKELIRELRKVSIAKEKPISELRTVLALERAVARISQNKELKNNIFYKGGFVLLKHASSQRFTKDVDAVVLKLKEDQLIDEMKKAFNKDLKDGLWFGEVQLEKKNNIYRFSASYSIGAPKQEDVTLNKLSKVYIDVELGRNAQYVVAKQKMQSVVGNMKGVEWKVSTKEYIIADKLESIVSKGSKNTRAKDFVDIALLKNMVNDYQELSTAIKTVFKENGTDIPSSILGFFKTLDLSAIKGAWGSLGSQFPKTTMNAHIKEVATLMNNIDKHLLQHTEMIRR